MDIAVPIKPELRGFHPLDWPELSASIRLQRAKGRCERCDRPHGGSIARRRIEDATVEAFFDTVRNSGP